MRPAALPFAACAALALGGLVPFLAAEDSSPSRAAPTRPGQINAPSAGPAVATTRLNGVDYLDVETAAARLGLRLRGRDGRKYVYGDANSRLVIDEGREIFLDGSRIFLGSAIVARQGRLLVSKIDFEACLVPLLAPELLPNIPGIPKVIVLDPGHGGTDNGMQNPRLGLKEKIFTLDVAIRLKKILETAGCKVILTRKDDRELSPIKADDLKMRSEISNRAKADLFVSIHFNALENNTKTGGTEIYTFTRFFQRSDSSAGVGKADDTEPNASQPNPSPVNRFDAWSSLLGQSIKRSVIAELKTDDRGTKTMHSGVLRGLNSPGVLVESVFLSNDNEARLAATPAYRQRIAQGIADGIRAYANALEVARLKSAPATGSTASASSRP